jgi:hypothetical protein
MIPKMNMANARAIAVNQWLGRNLERCGATTTRLKKSTDDYHGIKAGPLPVAAS